MSPDAMTPEERRRWRLILGKMEEKEEEKAGAGAGLGGLSDPQDQLRDRYLDLVYGGGLTTRHASRRGGSGAMGGLGPGSRDPSCPSLPDWLPQAQDCFPHPARVILQEHIVERRGMVEALLDPRTSLPVTPSVGLLTQLLRMRHSIPPRALELVRAIVQRVVERLKEELVTLITKSLVGSASASQVTRHGRSADVRWRRTIDENMQHYQTDLGTIIPDRITFRERQAKRRNPLHVILVVDQSGSMVESQLYAAVIASILASLENLATHVFMFDTTVVDVSDHLDDPVEIMMSTHLGGGTNIHLALTTAARAITDPCNTLMVLISDLCEGGSRGPMVRTMASMRAQGVHQLCLLGLTRDSVPYYDPIAAREIASHGIPTICATPDELVEVVRELMSTGRLVIGKHAGGGP